MVCHTGGYIYANCGILTARNSVNAETLRIHYMKLLTWRLQVAGHHPAIDDMVAMQCWLSTYHDP